MSPLANLLGIVLTSSAGFATAGLGYLPVSQLRLLGREFLIMTGAWIVIAALSPPEIVHWYLIIAILCLIAWTKREWLGGKFWLAAAGAIGLSLGMVFPLEVSATLGAGTRADLAALYLGGAGAGLGYIVHVGARRRPFVQPLTKPAAWVLVLAISWGALIEESGRRGWLPPSSPLFADEGEPYVLPRTSDIPTDSAALVVIILAGATLLAAWRKAPSTSWLSLATSLVAIAVNFFTQGIMR
jgi:hypothetical protein